LANKKLVKEWNLHIAEPHCFWMSASLWQVLANNLISVVYGNLNVSVRFCLSIVGVGELKWKNKVGLTH